MGKIYNIQLRAQAVMLAIEGYSHGRIAQRLNRTKRWVTKWVGLSICDEKLVHKSTPSVRPTNKILSNSTNHPSRKLQRLRRIAIVN